MQEIEINKFKEPKVLWVIILLRCLSVWTRGEHNISLPELVSFGRIYGGKGSKYCCFIYEREAKSINGQLQPTYFVVGQSPEIDL